MKDSENIEAFNEYCKSVVYGYYDHISHGGKGDEHEEKHVDMICGIRDIINHQKAEKENLIKIIQHRNSENEKLIVELTAMRGAANSYKAEVERLNNEVNLLTENSISTKYPCCVLCGNGAILTKTLDDYDNLIGDISAEGIKEFWNELKARNTMDRRIISVESGDNLVKELTERKEDEGK